jgi:phage shock protein C
LQIWRKARNEGTKRSAFLKANEFYAMDLLRRFEMNIRGTALRRSRTNRMIAGVCGGLQDFFGLDAFWFRLGFVLAMIPGGIPGIAVYLILWLIMPSE